jgi:hypothetical protein
MTTGRTTGVVTVNAANLSHPSVVTCNANQYNLARFAALLLPMSYRLHCSQQGAPRLLQVRHSTNRQQ